MSKLDDICGNMCANLASKVLQNLAVINKFRTKKSVFNCRKLLINKMLSAVNFKLSGKKMSKLIDFWFWRRKTFKSI